MGLFLFFPFPSDSVSRKLKKTIRLAMTESFSKGRMIHKYTILFGCQERGKDGNSAMQSFLSLHKWINDGLN